MTDAPLSERIARGDYIGEPMMLSREVAALEQERDELVALVGSALAQAKIDADENARLHKAIRKALTELRDSSEDMIEASEATAKLLYRALIAEQEEL